MCVCVCGVGGGGGKVHALVPFNVSSCSVKLYPQQVLGLSCVPSTCGVLMPEGKNSEELTLAEHQGCSCN